EQLRRLLGLVPPGDPPALSRGVRVLLAVAHRALAGAGGGGEGGGGGAAGPGGGGAPRGPPRGGGAGGGGGGGVGGGAGAARGAGGGGGSATGWAGEGEAVVVANRRPEAGQETVRRVVAAGGRARFQGTDVRREEDCAAVEAAQARFGRLDVLAFEDLYRSQGE